MVSRGKPKVQRSVGPVLIWGLLSLLMALTGAAMGYFVAIPAQVASAEPPVPKLLQVDDILAVGRDQGRRLAGRGYRAGVTAGRKRTRASFAERAYELNGLAYRQIFAKGLQAGEDQALAVFGSGTTASTSSASRTAAGRWAPVMGRSANPRRTQLCRDGAAICARTVDP